MEILIILNQWLEPQYFDHWQVSAKLRYLRIVPTPALVNSEFFGLYDLEAQPPDKAILRQVYFNLDYCYYESSSRSSWSSDLIVGAEWSQGILELRFWERWNWKKMRFTEPFQLEFPHHIPCVCSITQTPPDLKLKLAITPLKMTKGAIKHQRRMTALMKEINRCRL